MYFYLLDDCDADVRYESFIEKLVLHMENQIIVTPTEKILDHRSTTSTVWVKRGLYIYNFLNPFFPHLH